LSRAEDILRTLGVSKSFPGTQALKDVSISIKRGEAHALVGENGAGKSTLMKIIMGIYRATEGSIEFEGAPVSIESPSKALQLGISMIHQELSQVPYLSVANNIFLHRAPKKKFWGTIDDRKLNRETEKLLSEFQLPINPKTLISDLTMAQRQMVEIIRAISHDSKLIIMDEPTSSLDHEEIQILFKTIRKLKERGIAVVYISHRLDEIFTICDRVSVLRDGMHVGTSDIEELDKDKMITMMVGRSLDEFYPKVDVQIGEPILEVKNLSRAGVFSDINFTLHKGEILGFAGLVGAGRTDIVRCLFGIDPYDTGEITLEGRKLNISSPQNAIKNGIVMVPEDRKELGLVLCRSLKENLSLPTLYSHHKTLRINHSREKEEVEDLVEKLSIRTSGLETETFNLSGGNQQKIVISKWIMDTPKVLILDEPTRGIDVGAKSEIHKLMSQFAANGMSVIMISSELPELIGMADRILVFSEGKLTGEFQRSEFAGKEKSEESIIQKAFA
jgi:ABC-type sugar transport system ATPase subunit